MITESAQAANEFFIVCIGTLICVETGSSRRQKEVLTLCSKRYSMKEQNAVLTSFTFFRKKRNLLHTKIGKGFFYGNKTWAVEVPLPVAEQSGRKSLRTQRDSVNGVWRFWIRIQAAKRQSTRSSVSLI